MKNGLSKKLKTFGGRNKILSINYEELKTSMGYEDYFFKNFILPVIEENNYNYKFDKGNLVLMKKGDDK